MPGRGRGRPPHPDLLTPAEQRVLDELRKGGTNVEIAVRLGLSPETVKTHIARMLGKLGLDDRHALAAWRPDRERRSLLTPLALPTALASLGRPLLWAGAALGGMAVVAIVAVLLIAGLSSDDDAGPSPADRCQTPTAPTCIRAVYLGAPDDYAQVTDIPADLLLTPNSDGRYYVERGRQYTVVTVARLPTGWTHFYLQQTPVGNPPPVSASRLIPPVGTTYTFTLTTDPVGATLITFDLKQARPFVRPRPDGKPEIGDTVVTTQFEALPAPELTLVSRGEHDALQLEWTGGPTNVTTWQYRQRSWQDGQPLEWGEWTDIPSSGAATRGYRLTGLTEFTGYSVEMRGVVGPLTGPASNTVNASTHHRTNHPEMYPGRVVEGDGQTEWRLHRLGVLITIPAGKRLTVGQGSIAHGWIGTGDDRWPTRAQIDLYDEVTGSVLVLDSDTGREVLRRVVEEPAPEGSPSNGLGGVSEESDAHDANALFDQIVASVRVD